MALPAAMALSGLNEEHFSDGLDDVFSHGAVLLKSPSKSSVASTESGCSQESGISSMSSESGPSKNLAPYFDFLYKSQFEFKVVCSSRDHMWEDKRIFFNNRDILNLGANLQWKWEFQQAKIRPGVKYYFENRSQYSRVLGAHMPDYKMKVCPYEDCSFQEPKYA
ncbi:uncharacterized protein BDFB_013120 [Asbolus verrucosus]|uniref:Uncharacterized protein n=1 Tax=Asbolus verrucosus TaxID=1661398 RepID=A0A482VGT3_ASBVE|nr:uncharacterized protein BDFB_013120 [Asbolus verrucosus]